MEPLRRLGRTLLEHRQRLAPLVVIIGLVVVGGQVFGAMPRETRIRYDLGPDHAGVTEARIIYLNEGAEVKGARFHWSSGAPLSVRHTVELSPGRYEIEAELVADGDRRTIRRVIRVPADGLVAIDLYEQVLNQSSRYGSSTIASNDTRWRMR